MLLNNSAEAQLIHLRQACVCNQTASRPKDLTRYFLIKKIRAEIFKTLKQACSKEYQGAQGAFKDSMIH